jgi:hypothetical protein
MELEVELPDSSQKVRIPLSRNEQFEDVPMTVLSNGVKRTFSSRQVHHDSHAHYSDIATKSIISVRDVNGEKQFQGHFMHEGESYLLEHNKEGHQVKRVPITPSELLEKAKEEKSAIKRAISRKRRQAPGSSTTYVIEIAVCVDYKSYSKFPEMFGSSRALTELHMYYTHIMTGVDVAFRNIGNPSISIRVVSLHVDSTPYDHTCMPGRSVANSELVSAAHVKCLFPLHLTFSVSNFVPLSCRQLHSVALSHSQDCPEAGSCASWRERCPRWDRVLPIT